MTRQIQRPKSIEEVHLLMTGDVVSTSHRWNKGHLAVVYCNNNLEIEVIKPSPDYGKGSVPDRSKRDRVFSLSSHVGDLGLDEIGTLVFPPEKTSVKVHTPSEEFDYQDRWRLLGNL